MARAAVVGGLWIRVNAKDPHDPSVFNMAEAMQIAPPHAFGLVVALWCGLAEHQPDGNVSRLPDSLLESFAGWRGLPGAMAREFRAHCVDGEGVVLGWPAKMGKLLADAKADAERKRLERAQRKEAEQHFLEGHGVHGPTVDTERTVRRLSADSPRTPLRTVVVKQGAASDPSGSAAPLPSSGLSTRTSVRGLSEDILGESPDYPLTAYQERMKAFVARWSERHPERLAKILLDAAALFPPDGEMPAKVREAAIDGHVAATIRLEAGAPTYEQWVALQRQQEASR